MHFGVGRHPTDVFYGGFRPFFTDWQDTQPVNVDVTGSGFAGGVSGSYSVSEQDIQTPILDNAIYHYGDFTPALDNTTGVDSDGLSGVSVYDFTLGPGAAEVAGSPSYLLNHMSVDYPNGTYLDVTTVPEDGFKNIFESTSNGMADFIQTAGQANPVMLFDALPDPSVPVIPDLPPDLWFPNPADMWPTF